MPLLFCFRNSVRYNSVFLQHFAVTTLDNHLLCDILTSEAISKVLKHSCKFPRQSESGGARLPFFISIQTIKKAAVSDCLFGVVGFIPLFLRA